MLLLALEILTTLLLRAIEFGALTLAWMLGGGEAAWDALQEMLDADEDERFV